MKIVIGNDIEFNKMSSKYKILSLAQFIGAFY